MARMFLAVGIPENIRAGLKRYITKFKQITTGNFVQHENIHITLKFLDEVKDADKLEEQLAKIKSSKFKCEIMGAGIFPNALFPRVLWFGVGSGSSEFGSLAKNIDAMLSPLGFKPDNRFHAHATFCRIKKVKLGALMGLLDNYKTTKFGSFEVKEILLMESKLTPEGPVYKIVKKFPLSA